jgi:hypothetical protein
LAAYYSQFRLGHKFFNRETGEYQIPDDWGWGRMMDYGQTDGHPWIVSHMATPRENYPLNDSRFVFSTHRVTPTGASPAEGREQYVRVERDLGLKGDPELSEMSHEQCGEGGLAETLMEEFGDSWEAWDTDYNVGLPQIQQWLGLIDTQLRNPIRPELMGRSRIYFVAHEDEYQFVFDKKGQRYFVTPSKTEKGHKLLREEMPSYHYPPEEMGKPVRKMRPRKIKDDVIDTIRGFACKWGPTVKPMTKQERRIKKLPEGLHPSVVLAQIGQPQFVELNSAMNQEMKQLELREEQERASEVKRSGRFMPRPVRHRRYGGK